MVGLRLCQQPPAVPQHAGGLGPQQSTVRLDFWQHTGAPGAQQLTVADLQQPSCEAEVSCTPLQHGKQLASPALGVQVAPSLGWQQPACGPNPHPQLSAPVTPQHPRGSAGLGPSVSEHLAPNPPP